MTSTATVLLLYVPGTVTSLRVKSEEYHAEGLTSSLTCEGGGSE